MFGNKLHLLLGNYSTNLPIIAIENALDRITMMLLTDANLVIQLVMNVMVPLTLNVKRVLIQNF
jgi:hypothetical protein